VHQDPQAIIKPEQDLDKDAFLSSSKAVIARWSAHHENSEKRKFTSVPRWNDPLENKCPTPRRLPLKSDMFLTFLFDLNEYMTFKGRMKISALESYGQGGV
jgi:hypothetical protein